VCNITIQNHATQLEGIFCLTKNTKIANKNS
jgi:hypothetical protein